MRVEVANKPIGVTYTVTVDGEDISNRCVGFDTVGGWADCYVLEASGQLKIVDTGSSHGWKTYDTITERLVGDVFATKHIETIETYDGIPPSSWEAAFNRAKAYFKRVGAKK